MDLTKARYFLKIVETGSMARASEVLNVSPSALSKATRLLENQLGTKLITMSGKTLVITDSGQLFARETRDILRQVEILQDRMHAIEAPKREVKVATFEVFSTYFLSVLDIIDWNDFSLVLHEGLPGEIERLVLNGTVDLGITYQPVPSPDLDLLKVTAIEMGVFTNEKAFPGMIQTELPFVVPVDPVTGLANRIRGLDGWPADAYERKVKYRVTLLESALELVRQGRAAGYFPKFIVTEHNKRYRDAFRLMRRKSPYGGRVCTTDVFIVKRKSDLESDVIKQLARGIRKVCSRGVD